MGKDWYRHPTVKIVGGIFLLALISFFVTSGGFWLHGTLYWDNGRLFTQFRDNLHSLNQFGEIAWWFPHNQFGSPGYFHSILGVPNCIAPLFASLAAVAWVLGKLDIHPTTYHTWYVFYFGFLAPLLFLSSVWLLAVKIFRDPKVRWFVLFLAAFCPGVLINISDIGFLEPAAYGIFFASRYLTFLRSPSRPTFLMLTLSAMLLGLSLNNGFLYWGVLGVPLFVIVASCFPWGRGLSKAKGAFAKFPLHYWIFAAGLYVICTLPSFVTLSQGSEIRRSTLGEKYYSYEALKPGNPGEMLASSTPGMGSAWEVAREEKSHPTWQVMPFSTERRVGYLYLGLLCLPLLALGLLYGRSSIRLPLWVLLVVAYGVISLSAYSPWLSAILAWNTPLRGVNHYSDMTFRLGSYIFLVFGAAFGFETLLRRRAKLQVPLALLCAVSLSGAVLLYRRYAFFSSEFFGFFALFSFLYAGVLCWLVRSRNKRLTRIATSLFLALTLVDLSTHAFLYVRHIWESRQTIADQPAYAKILEQPGLDNIGIKGGNHFFFYTNGLLMYRPYLFLLNLGAKLETWPTFRLYDKAHLNNDIKKELTEIEEKGIDSYRSLVLDPKSFWVDEFRPFFEAPDTKETEAKGKSAKPKKESASVRGKLAVTARTYNRFNLQVISEKPAILFIKDAFSPYWVAEVNGEQTPIAQALYNFKAITVPAGPSIITFKFAPPNVGPCLFIAYFCLTIVALLAVGAHLFSTHKSSLTLVKKIQSWDWKRLLPQAIEQA